MNKTLVSIVALILTAIVAVFATSITAYDTSAEPLHDDPTPTPTQVIDYWTGSSQTFAWSHGQNCLTGSGWYEEVDATLGDCPEIVAPEDNYPAGIIVTLNSDNYDGDNRLTHGTNTNWVKKFNDEWNSPPEEMGIGDSICVGTSDACTSVEMSVDPYSDWEGYTAGPEYNTINSVRVGYSLGTTGGSNFTVTPIWYGVYDCEPVDPEEREFISSGLLHGTDDEGETFQLVPGNQYILQTGGGPWNDGTDDRYDVAVRFKTSHAEDPPAGEWGEWTAMGDLQGGDEICDEGFVDENGSVFMFTAEQDIQSQIQFRVNDADEEFDDNSGDVEYYWMGGEGSSQGCEDLWTVGAKVVGRSVPADTSYIYDLGLYYTGGNYDGLVAGSQSYLYKVVGSYDNSGVATRDTIVMAGASDDGWSDPANAFLSSNDSCEDETSDQTSWYGTTKSEWDPGMFGIPGKHPYAEIPDYQNNTGSVTIEWYEGSWTAPESDCATKWDIGTFIESPIIFADNEDGKQYPQATNGLVIGQAYYIESQGTPYNKDGESSYDFMAKNPALLDDWTDPETFFDCVTDIDQNRKGYYWIADAETIWLRAQTSLLGDHDDNSGTIKFNLYGAIKEEIPEGEECSDYWDLDVEVWRGEVDADDTSGYSVDHSVFEPGDVYAIEITGSYTDPVGNGKTGEIRRSKPGQGSVDWEDMEDWGGALCHDTDDGYDIVYFEASALADYEVRATSPVGNSGTMDFSVWSTDDEDKKKFQQGCENNYSDVDAWYIIKYQDEIFANNKGVRTDDEDNVVEITGYVMANEFTSNEANFKIETGYLDDWIGPPQWDLQISYDGGATWIFLQDWVDCWVDLGTPEGRGYFTTPIDDPGPFILRVYDVGGVWLDNTGGVRFSMWIDDEDDDPGDIWDDEWDIKSWGVGCYAKCFPPGLLQIGEWVEFARCRFTRWLAWCPEHAEALTDIRDAFKEVEPFRTLFEMLELTAMIRAEVDSYSWTDDEGGGGSGETEGLVQYPPNYLFMPGEGGGVGLDDSITGEETIWGSGEIDIYPEGSTSYRTTYNTELSEVMGTRMGGPMCFAFNVVDQLGFRLWFQMFWDVFMVVAFVMYIKKNWVDKLQ